jgi:glycerophosphoryl diester phosphodiesterase
LETTLAIVRRCARDYRSSWKALALADLAWKVVAFSVLAPLAALLFRALLAVSGRSVLADLDIVTFLLGPAGWLCLVAVGAVGLTIGALEQAALAGILGAASAGRRLYTVGALRFAAAHALPVVRVAARLIALTALVSAPFLAAAALAGVALLGDFDINYCLRERPPAFLAAAGIVALAAVLLVATLLRLFSGWLFALPLVVFEAVPPARALRASAERARGRRVTLVAWIAGWALGSAAVSAAATSIVAVIGRLVVPRATSSLTLTALAVGGMLVLWAAVNLAVNLLSSTTFATVLFNLYRHVGAQGPLDVARLSAPGTGRGGGIAITRRRLLVAAIAGPAVALAAGALALRTLRLDDDVAVTAHRGASAAAPENTLAAIRAALAEGADWIEMDVQETADGEVVVFHDSDFMRLARSDLRIRDATMADLARLDVGSWFAPEFSAERVPTLGQALDACRGRARVNIELKYYGHDVDLERKVAGIVEAHGMAEHVVIMSLEIDGLKKMKSIRPNWPVGLLMSVAAGDVARIEADFIAVNARFATRGLVRSAQRAGKDVLVWTVNDATTMSLMMGRGVDGVITDRPGLARSVIAERAALGAPERLLLEMGALFGLRPEFGEP